jgi:CRP/FNR family transcriptional regulator, cyclic AMP receptor protein
MPIWDIVGYVGSALVLTAFCLRAMRPLRIVALCSNVAFIGYGIGLGLAPVWLLHCLLLPINCWRLWQLTRGR